MSTPPDIFSCRRCLKSSASLVLGVDHGRMQLFVHSTIDSFILQDIMCGAHTRGNKEQGGSLKHSVSANCSNLCANAHLLL